VLIRRDERRPLNTLAHGPTVSDGQDSLAFHTTSWWNHERCYSLSGPWIDIMSHELSCERHEKWEFFLNWSVWIFDAVTSARWLGYADALCVRVIKMRGDLITTLRSRNSRKMSAPRWLAISTRRRGDHGPLNQDWSRGLWVDWAFLMVGRQLAARGTLAGRGLVTTLKLQDRKMQDWPENAKREIRGSALSARKRRPKRRKTKKNIFNGRNTLWNSSSTTKITFHIFQLNRVSITWPTSGYFIYWYVQKSRYGKEAQYLGLSVFRSFTINQ